MAESYKLFGWEIKRAEKDKREELNKPSMVEPTRDDGAVNVEAGGLQGSFVDLDGAIRTEAELVTKYRQMLMQPEVEKAVNEVINEAIVEEDGKEIVKLDLNEVEGLGRESKKQIEEEFQVILELLNFKKNAYDIFRRWYIDGRMYFHPVINEDKPEEGIKELRYIDPRKIRKIREIVKRKHKQTGLLSILTKSEYYIYNEKGFQNKTAPTGVTQNSTEGIKIAKDAIVHASSGLMDENNKVVLSYVHQAIKPLNQLRALEDATLIYHLSRAPERRVFYVDVGNLPKNKAEQHIKDMMTRYKNKISYNTSTGKVSDNRHFMHMNEDFWLPRRGGEQGTEIDVLSGGAALPDLLQSVEYFQDRLYRALQVPLTRMKPDAIYNIGRATEITRDEVNFAKFIDRVRNKFMELIFSALHKQLILKNIITQEDWDQTIYKNLKYRFAQDSYWDELKNLEIMNDRMLRLRDADDFAGKYYSHEWIQRNVLHQNSDEIKDERKRMESEMDDQHWAPAEPMMPDEEDPNMQAPGGPPPQAAGPPPTQLQPQQPKPKTSGDKPNVQNKKTDRGSSTKKAS